MKKIKTLGILPVILLTILLASLSCSDRDISEESLADYIQAKTMYIQGDIDNALSVFLNIHEKEPDFINNSFMIGKIYFSKEDYDNAENFITDVLEIIPYHIDSRKYLARIYFNQYKLTEAEEQINHALEISSEDPDLILMLADIKKRQEDFAGAIEYYKKVSIFETNFAVARIELAEIYRGVGMFDKTITELERALNILDIDSIYFNPVSAILEGLKNETE